MRAATTFIGTVLLGTVLLVGLVPGPATSLQQEADGPEVDPVLTLAIDPAADLVDGQTVTVTGTGFAPDEFAILGECPAPVADVLECAESATGFPDATGVFTSEYRLRAVITLYGPTRTVDCRTEPCSLVVHGATPDRYATVPLDFDPDAALRPPLTVTVTPDDGLADGQTVTVDLSNFTPGGTVTVAQCANPEAYDNRSCRPGGSIDVLADENGAARTTLVVRDTYRTSIDGTIDCGLWECAVLAFDNRDEPLDAEFGFADLTFAALPPAAPAEPTAVRPHFTG